MSNETVRSLLAATAIAVAGCSHTRPVESVRLATLSFERGMSAAEVEDILGSPDGASPAVCGASLPQPDKCVGWTYATNTKESLRVLFQAVDGRLLVDSWYWR
jgi:hypothetical protein